MPQNYDVFDSGAVIKLILVISYMICSTWMIVRTVLIILQ